MAFRPGFTLNSYATTGVRQVRMFDRMVVPKLEVEPPPPPKSRNT